MTNALTAGQTATDTFTYTVSDGTDDTGELVITITGVNEAPVAGNDTGSVDEGQTLTVNRSGFSQCRLPVKAALEPLAQ